MTLPDCLLVRRKDVMAFLGISADQFRAMVECGTVTPKFLQHDKRGRPTGRPMYSRAEVLEIANKIAK